MFHFLLKNDDNAQILHLAMILIYNMLRINHRESHYHLPLSESHVITKENDFVPSNLCKNKPYIS